MYQDQSESQEDTAVTNFLQSLFEMDDAIEITSTEQSLLLHDLFVNSDTELSSTSSGISEELSLVDNEKTSNYSIISSSPAPQFDGVNESDFHLNGIFSSSENPMVGGGFANNTADDDRTLSLPLDFIQISQLNKDCIVVYSVLFFLAVVGNLMVLSSVSRHDRLGKSRTPLLIMNLCIADLIVAFFLMPTEIFWRLTIAWKGGDALCKLSQFVRAFGLYLSSNVVICISIDRYFAIVYPLKLAGASKRVKWTLVAAWIISALFAWPQIFIYHVASHPVYPQFRQCVTKAFLKTGPYNELIYNVSSVAALYFIPLLVIIYTYTMILWKIQQKSREHRVANSQQETGTDTSNSTTQLHPNSQHLEVLAFQRAGSSRLSRSASKRSTRLMLRSSANQSATFSRARYRTLRLTLLILLSFIICWTAYAVMTLWYMIDRRSASQVDERLQEALFIMAVANSVINPLIYGTVGSRQTCQKRLSTWLHSYYWLHRIIKLFCYCCSCGGLCCNQQDHRYPHNHHEMMVNGSRRFGRSKSHWSTDLSPRNQVVTLRTMRSNSDIVLRFVRSFGARQDRNNEDGRENKNFVECGVTGATSHYIIPGGGSSISQNMSSTQV